MGMKKGSVIKRWIDLDSLPRSKSGNIIRWTNIVGLTLDFVYGKYQGSLTILEMLPSERYKVLIKTDDETFEHELCQSSIRNCQLGGAFSRPIGITHPELVKYFVNESDVYKYQAHSERVVKMKCPHCGTVRNKRIQTLTDFGLACPMCSDGISYPNKFMFNVLTQLKIAFCNEITKATPGFEWIVGNYRYDFYFENKGEKIFLEMDGAFHTRSNFRSYEKNQKVDEFKDNLALTHGVKVIRIDCAYSKIQDRFEYIKTNVLNSEFGAMFNLNAINWYVVDSFANDSNVRIAAELWNKEDCCAIDIGNKLGVSRDTARGYLKIAANIGLCNYNSQEIEQRMLRRIDRNNKNKAKPIALYKNGIMINVFLGVVDLDKQSKILYGIHMDFRNIYAVCNGSKKQAYGYTMKYITREEYEQLLPQFQTIQN